MTRLFNEEYGHEDLDEAKSSIPSRDRLSNMQNAVLDALGDPDEHHFYATGKSSRFDAEEMGTKKELQLAIKSVDAEIKKVAKTTREYITALKAMRASIVKNQRNKK